VYYLVLSCVGEDKQEGDSHWDAGGKIIPSNITLHSGRARAGRGEWGLNFEGEGIA